MYNYLIAFGAAVISFLVLFLLRKFFKNKIPLVFKITSGVLLTFFFVWYLLAGWNNLSEVINLTINSPFASIAGDSVGVRTCFAMLGVWTYIIVHAVFVIAPFFKYKIVNNLLKFFIPVLLILDFVVLPDIVFTYSGSFDVNNVGILISIELGIMIAEQAYFIAFIDHSYKLPKKEILEFVIAIIVVVFFAIPYYMPKGLVGNIGASNQTLYFKQYHRIYLYILFAYAIIIPIMLRGKDKEYNRMVLLYITFVAMINFALGNDFNTFIQPWRWPLHICNAAMYILPIALATKSEKVFYFTFFINILGALFASFMPDYNENTLFLSNEVTKFWFNHIEAAAMPLVCVFAKVFNRPSKKQFFWSMIAFLIYYVFIIFMNTFLTGMKPWFAEHCGWYYDSPDFLFINSDYIAKKVNAEFLLYDYQVTFQVNGLTFTFYPLYQAIYFFSFVGMSIIMWFVYVWIFKAQDALDRVHFAYKKVKFDELALCVKYGKKEIKDCMSDYSKDKLVISHFSKRYGEKAPFAVKDINFEAHAGEIVGFLGPNGAGKSTTIKAIVGIHLPSEGTIEINGYDIVTQPVQAKAQLGFVPDHYALYENLTGREYLNYIADLYDVSKEDRDAFLDEYLQTLQMKDAIDNKMQTYSHGMKQKIAIMASIIHNPKLWILDEPLTGLDPVCIYEVKQCLKRHAEKGNIVFFSSHLIDIVEKLCDRVVIISDHKVQEIADVKELTNNHVDLEKHYLQVTGLNPGR